jgi:3-hexulose-6-phosphate synthase/3-hexulose-6-phosphate synthase/6-phospho-3-hexuloisomerase
MARPLIQMALDSLDFDQTVALADQVAPYVDIFEIGTPCIKYNGINLVNAGEYEAGAFYAAGADICTVLGVSGLATIAGVIKAAKKHAAETQIDLINVADKAECARESVKLGAQIMGIHTGLDAQAAGQTPFADLNDIARLGLGVRISVAGGIKQATVQQVVEAGANIIVVGAAIYGAPSPAEAAREIRELVDAAAV